MKKIIISTLVIGLGILTQVGYGETAQPQPGSPDDPLITKSYVDQQMTAQINVKTDKIRADLNQMILSNITQAVQTELAKQSQDQVTQLVNAILNQKTTYQLVSVNPGQFIIFGGGAEVIVRNGKATIVSADKGGISDLSDGVDRATGKITTNNHLLLIPRDGRGLQFDVAQKSAGWVLVRGTYDVRDSLLQATSTPAPTGDPNATPAPSATVAPSASPSTAPLK